MASAYYSEQHSSIGFHRYDLEEKEDYMVKYVREMLYLKTPHWRFLMHTSILKAGRSSAKKKFNYLWPNIFPKLI